jgi:serine O-acetyltransferase
MRNSIWRALSSDLEANTGRGGAARGFAALFYHPGFCAIALHRIAARLEQFGAIGRFLGIAVWRLNVMLTGCYLNNRARIAPGLRLPHPIGVVVGADVVVGCNVTLYQNVTLGVSGDLHERCPAIHANCIVYAGAVIVGPISIGPDAVIGANSFVKSDVPRGALAVGAPAAIKRRPIAASVVESQSFRQ